jgi:sRNA-binding regulator protein Hfq
MEMEVEVYLVNGTVLKVQAYCASLFDSFSAGVYIKETNTWYPPHRIEKVVIVK